MYSSPYMLSAQDFKITKKKNEIVIILKLYHILSWSISCLTNTNICMELTLLFFYLDQLSEFLQNSAFSTLTILLSNTFIHLLKLFQLTFKYLMILFPVEMFLFLYSSSKSSCISHCSALKPHISSFSDLKHHTSALNIF